MLPCRNPRGTTTLPLFKEGVPVGEGVLKVEQPEVSLFLWLLFYAVLFVFLS